MRCLVILTVFSLFGINLSRAENGPLISAMDDLRFKSPKDKGKAELVDGKTGKANRFSFDKDARSTFCTSNLRGSPEWDKAAGFSFWVKGDGSSSFGGLQFIYDEDFSARYDFVFPIKSTEWTKITVAWSDLIAVLPGPKAKPLDPMKGNKPSKLSALWFGKWWYWGEYPAYSFTVDEIRLEPMIERDSKDYKPDGPPLKRVHDKLKEGKPITIVTVGDSLTDFRHWANRKVAWPNLVKDRFKETYKSETTLINPAIGGTQLKQGLALLPRSLEKAPEPDLVTLLFGFNDYEAGMRGEEFLSTYIDAVNRVRRATKGKADVLILTTAPAATRWKELAELSEACRKAAADRNAGLVDLEKAFHQAGKDNPDKLYVNDRVHLGEIGHGLVADGVLKAITNGGK